MVEDKILDYHSPSGNKFLIISMYNWRTTTDEAGIFEMHVPPESYSVEDNLGSMIRTSQLSFRKRMLCWR